MLFSKFFKRKKKTESRREEDKRYLKIEQEFEADSSDIVDLCEQLVDASTEFEDTRKEYMKLTYFFNDCVRLDELMDDEKNKIKDIASNVARLNLARTEMLNSESKLTDTQFMQMEENEAELPRVINRLKSNEKRLEIVKRDLKYLEGEKYEWRIAREEYETQQFRLKVLSISVLVIFALVCLCCAIVSIVGKINTQLGMFIAAFIAAAISAYITLKYQYCSREIAQCDVNTKHAISIENHVKIKYVNAQSAVTYTCERFHVNNSYELNKLYELYMEAIREKERFRKINGDLDYYNRQLINALTLNKINEPQMWISNAGAIVNNQEMVELKHDILERRHKVKNRLDVNVDNITDIRAKIIRNKDKLGDKVEQVNKILKNVAELNAGIPE